MISKAGLGSRTQARSWIHAGRVRVNGRVVENPDLWIDFQQDRIEFDGKPLRAREKTYILLHKPAGYITTFKDPEGRPTVYDLIGQVDTFVSPVGRLDLDTSGLLIFTNDTQLGELLTNPDHKIAKTYLVKCADRLDDNALDSLRRGVELSDGATRPARVRRAGDSDIEITITEGRNRQVRRMIEAVGSKVVELVRTQIGGIALDDLPAGAWRNLTAAEVSGLRPDSARM
ncbi:MAG: rRNA pseudouridine synthase [Acidobacteriota bacterium]|nr:rRNA pseudouridine synthase [Acidobacteriota bacterium]